MACLRATANAVSVAGESSGGVRGVFAGIGVADAVVSVVTAAAETFSVTVFAAWLVARYFPGDVDGDADGERDPGAACFVVALGDAALVAGEEPDGPAVSANAVPQPHITATPIPSAAASPPTRPM
jgi:hypothetical protein